MTKLKSLHMLLLTRYAVSKYPTVINRYGEGYPTKYNIGRTGLIELANDESISEISIISNIAFVRGYFQTKKP